MTELALSGTENDEFVHNGIALPSTSEFYQGLSSFLDLFRPNHRWHFSIHIQTNIPLAAGLASSASGFASLVKALDQLFNWQLRPRDLSILARLGSGSACRSIEEGFVEWHAGVQADGLDSFSNKM